MSLEENDAYAHYAMCIAHLMDGQAFGAANEADARWSWHPTSALAQNALGWSRIFTGELASAVEPIRLALRLSPRDPVSYFFNCALALAHFHLGDIQTSVQLARRAVSAKPRYFSVLVLVAALGRHGLEAEARIWSARAQELAPHDRHRFWHLLFPYVNSQDRHDMEAALSVWMRGRT